MKVNKTGTHIKLRALLPVIICRISSDAVELLVHEELMQSNFYLLIMPPLDNLKLQNGSFVYKYEPGEIPRNTSDNRDCI